MIKRLLLLSIVAGSLVGCANEAPPTDVTEIQKEAASKVPKGLEGVPPEQAQQGLKTMGGGKKSGGAGPGVAPP